MIQSVSRAVSHRSQPALVPGLPSAAAIRNQVTHCTTLVFLAPETARERAWWQSLYAAGICLRDALEACYGRWAFLGLSDQEVEHAYYTLIRFAYYFEPGGIAEVVFHEQGWVWLDETELPVPRQ